MNILFLTASMKLGWGVAVVVAELSRTLQKHGHSCAVGCVEKDDAFPDLDVSMVVPNPADIRLLAQRHGAKVVVAHSSPYFEVLPRLKDLSCYVMEHGEPTPDLFSGERESRMRRAAEKRQQVYPHVRGVAVISDFIRHDIGLPGAVRIYNGCDHVSDLGPKPEEAFQGGNDRPLRVGTLMRIGKGEAKYKGNDLFLALREKLATAGVNAKLFLMGRGNESDAEPFLKKGFEVFLNATDEQRIRYLRDLDVFVSCSLWEGFNLPLVEAQALGTAGIALDTGAHPEVTPFVTAGLDDMTALIGEYSRNRDLLVRHSQLSYRHVRQSFSWDESARRLLALVGGG